MTRSACYPGPIAAGFLCLAAWFATAFFIVLLAPDVENLGVGILGIGQALGMGAVASIGARWVPEPQPVRLGLRGFSPRLLPWIALLLPLTIAMSELVNVAHALFPPPDADQLEALMNERLDTSNLLALLETTIVVVGIAPVVEEWLYRGVVQQGLIAHLGRVGGVFTTACLFGFAHFQPNFSVASSLATFVAVLPLGILLGVLRIATGSLLAPILFHAAYNALGVAGLALADVLPIAGFNAPGDHTPAQIWVPCVVVAALGWVPLWRLARAAPPDPPIPPASPADDESGWLD